jgi:hypothetical protein
MTAAPLQLEDLLALAETLRVAGYSIGTQHYIARARACWITLAARREAARRSRARGARCWGRCFARRKREQQEFVAAFSKRGWQRRPQSAGGVHRRPVRCARLHGNFRGSSPQPSSGQSWRLGRLKAVVAAWLRTGWLWFKRPAVLAATVAALLLLDGQRVFTWQRPVDTAHSLAKCLSSENGTFALLANAEGEL